MLKAADPHTKSTPMHRTVLGCSRGVSLKGPRVYATDQSGPGPVLAFSHPDRASHMCAVDGMGGGTPVPAPHSLMVPGPVLGQPGTCPEPNGTRPCPPGTRPRQCSLSGTRPGHPQSTGRRGLSWLGPKAVRGAPRRPNLAARSDFDVAARPSASPFADYIHN